MDVNRRIIMIEFNELCPPLLENWMGTGLLSNFSHFFTNAQAFITEADARPPNLEPWIQWYSIHTGMPFSEHRVCHLTDGPKAGHEDIWSLLTAKGKIVWNCGSMNARCITSNGSAFLPDPWCTTEGCHPPELERYRSFVAQAVQEQSNASKPLRVADYASFLWFMFRYGLRPETVAVIARQLLSEIAWSGLTSWRRASLLDKLQFDVFRHVFRSRRPDFSTFFSNSTAHYQHSYWRHMAPEQFALKPSDDERSRYKDAILYGYQQMDNMLGDFFMLEDDKTMLVLATALSQQPYLKHDAIGGLHFYRPRDVTALLRKLGIDFIYVQPVMAHQFVVRLATPESKPMAVKRLSSLTYGGKLIFDFGETDSNSVYFGSDIKVEVPESATIDFGEDRVAFFDFFYRIQEIKSGWHHP